MQFSVRLCFSFAVSRHFQEVYLRGLLGFAGLFGRWDNVVHRLLLLKFGCPNVELETRNVLNLLFFKRLLC